MTERMTNWLFAIGLVALLGMVGCSEWDSSGDASAWDESYSWVDFSGMYSDAAMGVLVKDPSSASALNSLLVVNEAIGTGDGTSTLFSRVLAHAGVVPGSLVISAGGSALVDDAAGNLVGLGSTGGGGGGGGVITETATANGLEVNSGVLAGAPIVAGSLSIAIDDPPVNLTLNDLDSDGILESPDDPSAKGTIIYETGAWSLEQRVLVIPPGTEIRFVYKQDQGTTQAVGTAAGSISYSTGAWVVSLPGAALASGTPITATYRYMPNAPSASGSGNSGDPIFSILVLQTGDRLRMTDSNGNKYSGQLYDMEFPAVQVGGDTVSQGEVVVSFFAEGQAYGQWVTLEGTFLGNPIGSGGGMSGRSMNGTWVESGGQAGVFFASAAATAEPLVDTNTVSSL